METVVIERGEAQKIILASHGAKFWVRFIKKDGSCRDLDGIIRPPKPDAVRPSPTAFNPALVLVGDRAIYETLVAKGVEEEKAIDASYRCVNIETVQEFKLHNTHYIVQ